MGYGPSVIKTHVGNNIFGANIRGAVTLENGKSSSHLEQYAA